jgi:hypothetical protein
LQIGHRKTKLPLSGFQPLLTSSGLVYTNA